MKHTKFSNNLIKLSLFMIIVTSLFATISCENDAVGSSSAGDSSKLPDISDVGRSISLSGDNLVIKWNAPDITGAKKDDGTTLRHSDLSYDLYYVTKPVSPSADAEAVKTVSGVKSIKNIKSTTSNGITTATATITASGNLAAGSTYEIAIFVKNGSKESEGVKFEVIYQADSKPPITGLSTTPSDVRFFTAVASKVSGPPAVHSITVTVLDAADDGKNDYYIYYKETTEGAVDTISGVKTTSAAARTTPKIADNGTTYKLDNLKADKYHAIVVQQIITTTGPKYTSIEALAKVKTLQ